MEQIYSAVLALPGGPRTVKFSLDCADGSVRGTMSNPYHDTELLPVFDGTCHGGALSFQVMVGRVRYRLDGQETKAGLALSLTTEETIPLSPGKRISGKTGQIAGEYLIGVYSPGGVRENHLVLQESGGTITGEMFGIAQAPPPGMPMPPPDAPMPGGSPMPPNAPMPGGPPCLPGDKIDVNSITGGLLKDGLFLETTTAQGSYFRFEGNLSGDDLCLIMHVTDRREGIIATLGGTPDV